MVEKIDTEDTGAALEALQALDEQIEEARQRARSFGPRIEEVEEPALALESEVETTRSRLQEMKLEERRMELAADEKRARMKKLEDRLKNVRTAREQSAVQAELDMVERALEGDEQEALTLLDQIRKLELKLDEQEEELREAKDEVEPRRQELLEERDQVEERIEELRTERERAAEEMEAGELRLYERIRSGGGRKAVARLTADGACGHCFNVLPLQLQNEIRHGNDMIRCEGCGVILAPPATVSGEGGDEE